jgi:ATP/maltotriose-dependent transcriptional regulator MalT/DNA-binding SARP family transcriptional activator
MLRGMASVDPIPPLPPDYVACPTVQAALDEGAGHRLVLVVAGPGFGKTTQVAAWARHQAVVWYAVDWRDRDVARLATGLVRAAGPPLPAGALHHWQGSLGPQGGAPAVAEAAAASIAELFERELRRDLSLVVDGVDQLAPGGPALALLDALCQQAPQRLHLVLIGRTAPAIGARGLRGRGMVFDLDASQLRFGPAETAALLVHTLGAEADRLAGPVHELTGGWPAAVRMLAGALRPLPPERRAARLSSLDVPGEHLMEYLVGEVLAGCGESVRDLLPLVSRLPSFTARGCVDGGVEVSPADLADLVRRGLLTRVDDGAEPRFQVPPLLVSAVRAELPEPPPDRMRALREGARRWFIAHHRPAEALQTVRLSGDETQLVEHLTRHGEAAIAAGEVAAVAAAVDAVAEDRRTPELLRLAGEACQIRGDWQGALAHFRRAVGDAPTLPAGVAWRMGLIQYLRGELDDALALLQRGVPTGDDPETARLLSWIAAVHWLRNEHDKCRQATMDALATADASGDDAALAAAHTTRAMLATLDGDRAASVSHYAYAQRAAERAGDLLALMRIRNNVASRQLEEGDFRAAVTEFGEVVKLAELTGYATPLALATHNRGLAHLALGHLDEAVADFDSALSTYGAAGSRMAAYPLMRLAEVHRIRGDLTLAQAAYEQAATDAGQAGDAQAIVPALAGLARVVVLEDPAAAADLVTRAVGYGPGVTQAEAQLAAGWVALVRGDRHAAATWAHEALTTSRVREHRARMAEAIELAVLAADPPSRAADRLGEAEALWRHTGHLLGQLTNAYLRARLNGHSAAAVEHRLRVLGIRVDATRHAAGPLWWATTATMVSTVEVRTLGGFVVYRHDDPAGPVRWRSKKARDLLKLLIARRGQAVAREAVAEALWPGEEPTPVANRLSVALSTVRTALDPVRRFDPDHFVRADKDSLSVGRLDVDVLAFLANARDGLLHLNDGDHEAARVALATAHIAYTGDFLEDDPYAEWATPLREEARATYRHVTRALADLAARAGDTDDAVRYLLRLLAQDPFDEPAHHALIRELRHAGRHGEARRRYQMYTDRMAELDIDPTPYDAISRSPAGRG